MGSNHGTVNWMDIFSHIFVVKNCNVCLKNEKEAAVGPFLRMSIGVTSKRHYGGSGGGIKASLKERYFY